ncbi:hypothetical protein [Escherichia coli ISC41]|nr:hypothetical protein [Escherichia coli ISC41]
MLKVNLFKTNDKKKYFLDLSGGAADLFRGFSDDMVYFVKRMKNSLLKIQ